MIKQLKKDIAKDFGKKCPRYAIGCYTCMAWRAFEDLEQLYEDDLDFKINHDIKEFKKDLKSGDCKNYPIFNETS